MYGTPLDLIAPNPPGRPGERGKTFYKYKLDRHGKRTLVFQFCAYGHSYFTSPSAGESREKIDYVKGRGDKRNWYFYTKEAGRELYQILRSKDPVASQASPVSPEPEWTEEQRQIIAKIGKIHRLDHHLRVDAIAGSGKTLVIRQGIRDYLRANPKHKILSLTFSTKLAEEMRKTLADDYHISDDQCHSLTFHKAAHKFLFDNAHYKYQYKRQPPSNCPLKQRKEGMRSHNQPKFSRMKQNNILQEKGERNLKKKAVEFACYAQKVWERGLEKDLERRLEGEGERGVACLNRKHQFAHYLEQNTSPFLLESVRHRPCFVLALLGAPARNPLKIAWDSEQKPYLPLFLSLCEPSKEPRISLYPLLRWLFFLFSSTYRLYNL